MAGVDDAVIAFLPSVQSGHPRYDQTALAFRSPVAPEREWRLLPHGAEAVINESLQGPCLCSDFSLALLGDSLC